ncbi:N-alpha-acetyltransferase 80 [Cololabis saira]|uniref:N-alpha-acetyltransferase 80 n=1 Tax=Cololabis saira TaxID=129043 RepID=UPI002AD47CD6|nr:N-alpha-acetyltransferase 80 [Cololabis saira]
MHSSPLSDSAKTSEPITSLNSKPKSRDELRTDLHLASTPDRQTPGREDDSENPERIRAVPIHQRPDLLVPCADLVNSEWQRSQAARVHSLQKSCSEFPVCLVLLQGHAGSETLIGHARLSRVVGHGGSLFVESVVVSRAERGKGYGRTLMEEAECYAKRRGFRRLHLTTHDKQHFYAHLGYVLSTPVQSSGAVMALVPANMLLRLSKLPDEESGGHLVVQTLTETPYRDAKGTPIFWMHKDI